MRIVIGFKLVIIKYQYSKKAMTQFIKFVLDTEDFGIQMKPIKTQDVFSLEGISDCDYRKGDTDTRYIVDECNIYLCESPFV
jgi:hypothetical protein